MKGVLRHLFAECSRRVSDGRRRDVVPAQQIVSDRVVDDILSEVVTPEHIYRGASSDLAWIPA